MHFFYFSFLLELCHFNLFFKEPTHCIIDFSYCFILLYILLIYAFYALLSSMCFGFIWSFFSFSCNWNSDYWFNMLPCFNVQILCYGFLWQQYFSSVSQDLIFCICLIQLYADFTSFGFFLHYSWISVFGLFSFQIFGDFFKLYFCC